MKGYYLSLTAFLLMLLVSSGTALANDNRVLKVGIEDIEYYPHLSIGYRESSFAEIVLKRFFKEQGYKVVFVPLPVKRFNNWFLTGDVDFKYPDNSVWRQDEKHDTDITYSLPSVSGVIRTKENRGKPFSEIRNVGTILGFFPQMWYDKIKTGEMELLEESNPRTVVKLPIKGLVDAIGIDFSVVHYYLGELGLQNKLLMDPCLPNTRVGFSLSTINKQEIIFELNQFIASHQDFIQAVKEETGIIDDPIAYSRSQLEEPRP
jgi:polar amino acid transport system substrate-binding protein